VGKRREPCESLQPGQVHAVGTVRTLSFLMATVVLAAVSGSTDPLFEVTRMGMGPNRGLGDIVELKDGTLLFAYHVNPTVEHGRGILARTSKDRGRTWGDEFTLVPQLLGGSLHEHSAWVHPSLLRLPNGDILLSYIVLTQTSYFGASPLRYSATGTEDLGLTYFEHNYYRRSADEGQSWSDQYIMTPQPGCNEMHNAKLILLSSGRIVAPLHYKKRGLSIPEDDHGGYVSYCFYSDDNGYSWLRSKIDVDMLPTEAQEPHVVELKDGRLMMLFRTYSGFVGQAFSDDRGETWSKGELVEELPMPTCAPLTVDRIPTTGDLLLTMPTGPGGRTPLFSMISRDEGKTWTHRRNILDDPNERYGYQFVEFLDDEVLILTGSKQGVVVIRTGVDWFYEEDEA